MNDAAAAENTTDVVLKKKQKSKNTFLDAPLPESEMVVDGPDFFQLTGKYLYFIQMLSLTAKDMMEPTSHPDYQDALEFLNDTEAVNNLLDVICADHDITPIIIEALKNRPLEIYKACSDVSRNSDSGGASFKNFMEMMGCVPTDGHSSLISSDDEDASEMSMGYR